VDWDGTETLGVTDGAIEAAMVLVASIGVVPGIIAVVEVVVVDVAGGGGGVTHCVLLYMFK
jgi:hypothetical protein